MSTRIVAKCQGAVASWQVRRPVSYLTSDWPYSQGGSDETGASAQPADTGGRAPLLHVNDAYRRSVFDLHPELTKDEFEAFTAELGSVLRFRQLGDTTTLGRGNVEVSVQFANTPFDDSKVAWNTADHCVGRSISFPQVVARFGVNDRADVGAWGGSTPPRNTGWLASTPRSPCCDRGPRDRCPSRSGRASRHWSDRPRSGLAPRVSTCQSVEPLAPCRPTPASRQARRWGSNGRRMSTSIRPLPSLPGTLVPVAGAQPVGGRWRRGPWPATPFVSGRGFDRSCIPITTFLVGQRAPGTANLARSGHWAPYAAPRLGRPAGSGEDREPRARGRADPRT